MCTDQPTLWDGLLPDELFGLPDMLPTVGGLRDDERFFAPFRGHFYPAEVPPSIPIETHRRRTFLKHRQSSPTASRQPLDGDECAAGPTVGPDADVHDLLIALTCAAHDLPLVTLDRGQATLAGTCRAWL